MSESPKRDIWSVIIAIATLVILFGGGYLIGHRQARLRSSSPGLSKLQASLDLIDAQYVDPVSTDSLVEALIPDLMSGLDPHSSYLTAEQRRSEREEMEGYFYGIGIVFNMLKDTAIVIRTISNGPSDLVGVQPGDRIIEVDGEPIDAGLPADSVMRLLKGPNGSMVELTLRPAEGGSERIVRVTRGEVSTSKVGATYMQNDSLGVIRLDGFSVTTYDDFMESFAQLLQQGMKGLILDLRDNPGGVLEVALRMVNEMLPMGRPVIYIEGAHYPRENFISDGTGSLVGFPLYILINESSASAAEIVSGAMQDNDAAIVIGRRSFGKGLVQKIFEYEDGSSVHLTIARYYTPSGRCIQREYRIGEGERYYSDWVERFSNGELFSSDSIDTEEENAYKTLSGRTVYGGGGIIPDLFVPQDSTQLTSYTLEVLQKSVLQRFAFLYADTHRKLLTEIGDPIQTYRFLNNQGLVWLMGNYASQQYRIPLKGYLIAKDEEYMTRLMAQSIIMYIYGDDAMAQVSALDDPAIALAEELFARGIYSPLDLPDEEDLLPVEEPSVKEVEGEDDEEMKVEEVEVTDELIEYD